MHVVLKARLRHVVLKARLRHVVLKARLRHDERGDAERGQMRRPCDAVGEAPGRVGLEQIDDFPRQIVLAHISEAGVVDEVRGVAGVEQLQEV